MNNVLIQYLVIFLIFLLPSFITIFTYDTFELNKLTLLRIITIILLLLFLIKRKVVIKKTVIDIPIIFYLFFMIISSIFSVSPLTSLTGVYSKFDGLLTCLNFIFIYYLIVTYFKEEIKTKFTYALIASAVIPSIYAILQHYKIDFITWESYDPRAFATLGYSTLLASYLVLILPFMIVELLDNKKNLFLLPLIILSLLALTFTYSRAGYIGFIISLIIIILFSKKRLYFFIIILIAGFITLFVSFLKKQDISYLTQRVLSTVNFSEGSVAERIDIWKSCIEIVKDNPITGTGLSTLYLVFLKYKSKESIERGQSDIIADKAHNEFLDKACIGGFFLLFSYLWLLITIFWKLLISKKDKFIVATLSAITGYLVTLQFGYSIIPTEVIFFSIIGVALLNSKGGYYTISNETLLSHRIIFISLFTPILIFLTMKFYLADVYFAKGIGYFKQGNFTKAKINLEKATKLNTKEVKYIYGLADMYYTTGNLKKAAEKLEYALTIQPTNFECNYALMMVYYRLYEKEKDMIALNKALYYEKKVNELYPNLKK